MRIAVFGANSFIGRAFLRRCALAGHQILAIGRQLCFETGVVNYQYDVRDENLPSLAGCQAVFYFPMSPGHRHFPREISDVYEVNVCGLARVAERAIQDGCSFLFYASTGSVYTHSFSKLSEQSPVDSSNVYAASKLAAEKMLELCLPYIHICNGRLFGPFGEGNKGLPKDLHRRISQGMPIVLHPSPEGDKEGLHVSFLLINDMADILLKLAERGIKGEVPPVVNIAGPKGYSLREFSEYLAAGMGRQAVFEYSKEQRQFDLIADISLLTRLVKPHFTELSSGILKLLPQSGESLSL